MVFLCINQQFYPLTFLPWKAVWWWILGPNILMWFQLLKDLFIIKQQLEQILEVKQLLDNFTNTLFKMKKDIETIS